MNKIPKFRIRIAECGTSFLCKGYKKMEDDDALRLAYNVVKLMTEDFIFDDNKPNFRYHLACLILKEIKGYKIEDLAKHIENADKFIGGWKMVDTSKTNKEVNK